MKIDLSGYSDVVRAQMESGTRELWKQVFLDCQLVIDIDYIGDNGVKLVVTLQDAMDTVLWTLPDMPCRLRAGEKVTIGNLAISPRYKSFELS